MPAIAVSPATDSRSHSDAIAGDAILRWRTQLRAESAPTRMARFRMGTQIRQRWTEENGRPTSSPGRRPGFGRRATDAGTIRRFLPPPPGDRARGWFFTGPGPALAWGLAGIRAPAPHSATARGHRPGAAAGDGSRSGPWCRAQPGPRAGRGSRRRPPGRGRPWARRRPERVAAGRGRGRPRAALAGRRRAAPGRRWRRAPARPARAGLEPAPEPHARAPTGC